MKKTAFCSLPFERLKVDCEGNVTMCCFQERKCLGNILETSLEEIWNSDLANEIRRVTSEGELHKSCQVVSCPFYHATSSKEMKDVWHFEYPSCWEIDMPSQHCNIGGENPTEKNPACLMCERHLRYEPQVDKLREVCEKLRPYVEHVHAVHIQGIAEAFWKDYIFDVLEWSGVDEHKEHICVSTTTNGTILHEARRRRWLKYPTSVITFSVDAATPETYELIRRVPLYHRIVDNLLAYSRERVAPWQQLRIHNNINLLNIKEVEGMVELAARAGASIDFNPTYAVPFIGVHKGNAYMFEEAEQRIIAAAARLNVPLTFMRRMTLDHDPYLRFKNPVVPMDVLFSAAEKLAVPVGKLIEVKPASTEVLVPLL
jgi:MoaA/NifB/PqqE/SkfB family radical SAM enzyme